MQDAPLRIVVLAPDQQASCYNERACLKPASGSCKLALCVSRECVVIAMFLQSSGRNPGSARAAPALMCST
jgi:hypothetical protein